VTPQPDLEPLAYRIREARALVPPHRSALVAITGIDASGKGYVAARIGACLEQSGLRVAILNADHWLNLPATRFSQSNPAEHFYRHAFRFAEMFDQLLDPLRNRRCVSVDADVTDESATTYRRHRYQFDAVDVTLVEGIFLLKRALQDRYDLSAWIDCSVDTALRRAVRRAQEGLPPGATVHAYRTIYFPAQEIHQSIDAPRAAASMIVVNDQS
jgi:uridine kinase